MTKANSAALNQLIAIESGLKTSTSKAVTDLHRQSGKIALFSGITRTYQPKDDDGDKLPPESTLVQTNAEESLKSLEERYTRLFDVTLTKETGNTEAKADVVVDGKTIVKDAPVTYLLFLEKKLVDINSFILALPTLDPAQVWTKDANTGVYASAPVQTVRSKKVPRNWVKAPATDKHPAQVETYYEDIQVGTWTKQDLSGALSLVRKNELLERVEKLSAAVKFAREAANSIQVDDKKAAGALFSYLLS